MGVCRTFTPGHFYLLLGFSCAGCVVRFTGDGWYIVVAPVVGGGGVFYISLKGDVRV